MHTPAPWPGSAPLELTCVCRPCGQALLPWSLHAGAGPVAGLCSPGVYMQVLALWPGAMLGSKRWTIVGHACHARGCPRPCECMQ